MIIIMGLEMIRKKQGNTRHKRVIHSYTSRFSSDEVFMQVLFECFTL